MYVAYPVEGLHLAHVLASGSFIELLMILVRAEPTSKGREGLQKDRSGTDNFWSLAWVTRARLLFYFSVPG